MTDEDAPDGREVSAGDHLPAPPFQLPDQVPAVAADLTGLSRADAAGPGSFLAEGGALWVAGVQGRGGFRVGEGRRILAEVTPVEAGAAANALLFPGVVRRDFVGPTGPFLETLVVPPRLPLVVARWSSTARASGDPAPFVREVAVELPPGPGDDADVVRHDDQLHLRAGERWTVLAMVPAPLALSVERSADERVRAVFTPAPGPDASLLMASGPPDRVRSALRGAQHLRAHALRAASGPTDGLVVRTGVSEIDDGVLWLRSRIAGQAARATGPRLSLGLAAVGTGARDAASALLATGDGTSAVHGLLAARVASVFGDLGPASAVADRWTAGGEAPTSPLSGLAAGALARALDRSVPPDLVARLRELASSGAGTGSGERRLPTVGATRSGGTASEEHRWWASLLDGAPSGPVLHHERNAVTEARQACVGFTTAPDEAWSRWRAALVESASGSPRTLWDPLPGPTGVGESAEPEAGGDGSLAAELLLGLIHGLLGIDADAPVGRLRLAPRLPSHLRSFSVGGIPVGSCSVALGYRREGDRHVWELSPETAPVPPLIVLEASIPGRVGGVEVDGEAAELDLEVRDGRTRVPVQLPLDRTRVVVVESS